MSPTSKHRLCLCLRLFIPPAAGISLAFAAELSGLRRLTGIGGEGISVLALLISGILFTLAGFIIANPRLRGAFNKDDILHTLTLALAALCCLLVCMSAVKNVGNGTEYPLPDNSPEGFNLYIQQFDAFEKGQVALDLPVSDELLAMENPYDKEAREAADVDYFWDRAFHNGKYYSYFGLAPLICVYYPCYILTGELPSNVLVTLVFALLTVLFLSLAYRELLIFANAKPPLWLAVLGLLTVAAGCGVWAGQSYSDMYYFPVLSAMGFNFAFGYFVLRASRAVKAYASSILFAFAGAAFVLSVMSRPTASLMCIVFLPPVLSKVFVKVKRARKRLALCAPAAVVAAAGAAAVMSFNFLRFGSVLDFGVTWQLTVSDISQNTVSLSLTPAAAFHYLLQAPEFFSTAPWLRPSFVKLDYGRYIYVERTLGLICFPAVYGFFTAFLTERARSADKTRLFTFIAGAVMILVVAFLDFCMAGVNMRYLFDVLPTAVLLGSVLLLRFAGKPELPARGRRNAFCTLCFLLTVCVSFAVILSNEADRLFAAIL